MEKNCVNYKYSVDIKEIFPFELDEFQLKAIAALNVGKSVVVAAPTGSGKTVIGEYAIYRALSNGKRVFYTTPLKALSNQKFRDFQEKFGRKQVNDIYQEVGLITGDILINPEAPIVVMTTEIFRNMLYETPIGQVGTSLEDVETVVLDECHYISDRGRGTVWEESIIYCPPQIQLVALSATIGNPEELTDWINKVRAAQNKSQKQATCELINSDFRPVPLRFHFINKKGIFPLLNNQQTQLNKSLKALGQESKSGRIRREDLPNIYFIVSQLQARDMLPAIYVIFSRRGCDQAVSQLRSLNLVSLTESIVIQKNLLEFFLKENLELQSLVLGAFNNHPLESKLIGFLAKNEGGARELIEFLETNLDSKRKLYEVIGNNSQAGRAEQIEPLTRGIAAHHAGILPAWKELVETLFELGLVKVVFATATLAAGINMPARTTVISALSKRTDTGHSMLTPSEFLQIAGRAGRRGMDEMGHVVTVQTAFEGAKEAAYLATAKPEPLISWFTPSYGMVLNLLQKHTIHEAKNLLERSFAEYLAQLKLGPEQKAIAQITTELAKIDVELAPIKTNYFTSYMKLGDRLKEEKRILKYLEEQAATSRKKEISPTLFELQPGRIMYLKGKHLPVGSPIIAVLVAHIPGSGKAPIFLCLGNDNRWYVVTSADVADLDSKSIPPSFIETISLPDLENVRLGKWHKGDEVTGAISEMILDYAVPRQIPLEITAQEQKIEDLQQQLDNHALQQFGNPGNLIKRYHHRLSLKERLNKSQSQYQKHKTSSSYYWKEFLALIKVLQKFGTLEGYHPTPLGEAAATIRGENELWLGLALMSGELHCLEPAHLAGVIAALITESPRPDSETNYLPSMEVLETFKKPCAALGNISLSGMKWELNQAQYEHKLAIPVWLEIKFIGLVEQWAMGVEWNELGENTSLDEGDIVRMFRRTIDVLWQIPQIPGVHPALVLNAKAAIRAMKRFPV
ncbi:MAG: DEAD/DEAH box helicase [Gomphosphaeria aponina SAG 52.96 = DSM 107014]|uniref:DEAD/DEAH box helicase n=1 Tax=Gomphosphaeria aponina SAG 52.96 = DSM 107014 TaxID=1521640 RepID=A0A941JSP5_9CHRO|nr:DEAD/DEAH box helicase [Gomphosphaeria aponina SAG 52.96 = DSM 107014]